MTQSSSITAYGSEQESATELLSGLAGAGGLIARSGCSLNPGATVSGINTYVENVDRFQKQDATEDPTVYGRVSGQPLAPAGDARIEFYTNKARETIASFRAAFGQEN
ncbi:hypothetical protein VTH82DRAFT_7954 [Thermothelomyces myriococcoides]